MKLWKLLAGLLIAGIATGLLFADEKSDSKPKTAETDQTAKATKASEEKPAPEGKVSLKEIFNHRKHWPRSVTVLEDTKSGDTTLAKGTEIRLIAVNSAGLKVRNDDGTFTLPHDATSLVDDIESKLDGQKLVRVVPEPEPEPGEPGVVSAGQERAIPGDELVNADGSKRDKASIGGKFVGIYFSAKWCPPCRTFTPSLVKFRDNNADEFEVIFVSSDRDAKSMQDYMKSYNMNFAATKFGSTMQREISKKYAARGIPHLVIISPDGRVVSRNGRGDIAGKGNKALDAWKTAAAR